MAVVYLARDKKHDRSVAIKILHPEIVAGMGADRFLLEIRILARLQHPHILALLDSGATDEAPPRPYYVMRSEEHTSELQSRENLVCRLLLEKKKPRSDRNNFRERLR